MGINQVDDPSLPLYQAKLVPIRRPSLIPSIPLNNREKIIHNLQPAGEGVSSSFPSGGRFCRG
jgi:hypothetical protein